MPAVVAAVAVGAAGEPSGNVSELAKGIRDYEYGKGSRALLAAEAFIRSEDDAGRRELETAFHGILRDSSVGLPAKDAACRLLRHAGTQASVPVLGALLKTPETTHMALYALRHIRGSLAETTLARALNGARGLQKAAIVVAMGESGAAAGLPPVAALFRDPDPRVARAAYQAAARIGGTEAVTRLMDCSPDAELQDAWVDACLTCADNPKTDRTAAGKVYAALCRSERRHVRYAALRGLVRSGRASARNEVLSAFRTANASWRRAVAVVLVRERDAAALDAVAAGLPGFPPESRRDAIALLAGCRHGGAAGAIRAQLTSEDASVAAAAAEALGTLGRAEDVDALLQCALRHESPEKTPAFGALVKLADAEVDDLLVQRLDAAEARTGELCVRLLAGRNHSGALPALIALAGRSDGAPLVAIAEAMKVLGDIRALPTLIEMIRSDGAAAHAAKALVAVCGRSDPEACTRLLMDGCRGASATARAVFLRRLSALGNPAAVEWVGAAAKGTDPVVRGVAVRGLSNWPNAAPMDTVWALAQTEKDPALRIIALRGYVRMISLAAATPKRKTAWCRKALDASARVDEKRLVLSELGKLPCVDAFELGLRHLDDPALREEAATALVAITREDGAVRAVIPGKVRSVMKKVIATSRNAHNVNGARQVLAQCLMVEGELVISNASFERDQDLETTRVADWLEERAGNRPFVGGFVMREGRNGMPVTPHGNQWLELIGQPGLPGSVYQQVGAWQAERFLTVTLTIGNRSILPDSRLTLELWAGGNAKQAAEGCSLAGLGARRLAATTDLALPVNGGVDEAIRSLPTGKAGSEGEPLWLRLVQRDVAGPNGVVLIDNISACWTAEAVGPCRPEPAPESAAARQKGAGEWPFFAFCMSHHDSAKRSLARQAALFRELGYDGCGHLCKTLGYGNLGYPPNATVEQRAQSLAGQGLRLYQAYARVHLTRDPPVDFDRVKQIMPTLKAHGSQLVVLLLADRSGDLDNKAVAVLGRIADIAKPYGIQTVIYPHTGDYVETAGEGVRILRKLDRPAETGIMFNLHHWINRDPDRDVAAVLKQSAPWLKAVSINGSPSAEKARVLPLGQGGFDVGSVLGTLRELDYEGPVGLMCWGIGGDARTHLTSSMKAWQGMASAATSAGTKKVGHGRRIVFIGGADSHGPGEHDHRAGAALLKSWVDGLETGHDIETVLYLDRLPDDLSELDGASAIVLMWEGWERHLFRAATPAVLRKLDALMAGGTGLVCLHAATAVGEDAEAFQLRWAGGNKKKGYSTHPMVSNVTATVVNPAHPVSRGVKDMTFPREEFYRRILFALDSGKLTPILRAEPAVGEPGDQVIAWAFERPGGGRALCCTGPHFHSSFQNPDFRRLLLNAILWTARL